MSGLLDGIRIVDLTQVLAGPFCTMLLADLGADVIKVEPPTGDPTRSWGPYRDDDELRAFGGYFASVNRNKSGICLDLTRPEGRTALLRVLEGADVLVENYRPGVMERLDLAVEQLRVRFPSLVYASIRGFGDPRTGRSPYADWPSYDIVAQAMAGLALITGFPGGPPVKTGPGVGDIYPATVAAVGILAAVLNARSTGEGCHVDVGLYDSVLALCERSIYQWSLTGVSPGPQGNGHGLLCPYGLFPTADGWVALAAPADHQWALLAEVMGRPDLAIDADLVTNAGRAAHRTHVDAEVAAWTSTMTTTGVVAVLGGRVPCGPVSSAADIVADPHVQARRMIVEVEHPGTGPVALVASPIKVAGASDQPFRRAPLLGEHNEAVLAAYGCTREEIEALRPEGTRASDTVEAR